MPVYLLANDAAMLEAAVGYARRGWSVFPLAASKKTPITSRGFLDATTDEAQIVEWWGAHQDANIGIACGASGLIVIDVDGEEGEASLAALVSKVGGLPETAQVRTGRDHGRHLLYRAVDGLEVRNNLGRYLGTHIDVRAEGGYIVAPPSTHPNGRTYEWLRDCPPADFPMSLIELKNEEDEKHRRVVHTPELRAGIGDTRPGDDFNARATWSSILEPHGWCFVGANGVEEKWCRPDKDTRQGPSATVNFGGSDFLWVFSTSTIFEPERSYTKFGAYAALNHNGDHREAAIALGAQGYGDALPERVSKEVAPFEDPEQSKRRRSKGTVKIKTGSEYGRKRVQFAWGNRLPLGKLTLLAGVGGKGKSFLSIALAAHVTAGVPLPDCHGQSLRGDVLFCSYEDDVEDTIGPRCDAMGVDMDRMHFVEAVETPLGPRPFGPNDVPGLVEHLEDHPEIKLVVIDPLGSFMGAAVDGNAENQMRAVLTTLTDAAQKTGAAVVMVAHFKKGSEGEALHRISGSQGISAISRSVLVVGEHEEQLCLAHAKHNLTPEAATLAYKFDDGVITWKGVLENASPDDVAATKIQRQPSKIDLAAMWLRDLLRDGPLASTEVQALAEEEGIKDHTLRRARERLHIEPKKVGNQHSPSMGWLWELPE